MLADTIHVKQIKELVLSEKESVKSIAEITGVPHQTIYALKNGRRSWENLSMDTWSKLEKILK